MALGTQEGLCLSLNCAALLDDIILMSRAKGFICPVALQGAATSHVYLLQHQVLITQKFLNASRILLEALTQVAALYVLFTNGAANVGLFQGQA